MNLKRSLNDPYKVASICYALYGFVYLCGAVIELSPDRMRPGFGFLPWWSFYLMGLVVLVTFPVIIWKRYRAFISLSTALTGGFAVWCILHEQPVMGILSFGAGIGLIIYGNRFLKKWKSLSGAFILFLGLHSSALIACSSCFSGVSGPDARGLNLSILTLLGVISSLLVGFMAFFIYLCRRAKLFGELEGEV